QVERRELPNPDDVSPGQDNREPADNREEDRDRAEQAALAAGRRPPVTSKGKADSDAADENQMWDRKDESERGRQSSAIRQARLDADGNRVRHQQTIPKAAPDDGILIV